MVQAASWYLVYLRELPSSLYLELLGIGTYSSVEYVIHFVGQPLNHHLHAGWDINTLAPGIHIHMDIEGARTLIKCIYTLESV